MEEETLKTTYALGAGGIRVAECSISLHSIVLQTIVWHIIAFSSIGQHAEQGINTLVCHHTAARSQRCMASRATAGQGEQRQGKAEQRTAALSGAWQSKAEPRDATLSKHRGAPRGPGEHGASRTGPLCTEWARALRAPGRACLGEEPAWRGTWPLAIWMAVTAPIAPALGLLGEEPTWPYPRPAWGRAGLARP